MSLPKIEPRRLTAVELLALQRDLQRHPPGTREQMVLGELAWTRQRLRDLEEKLGEWQAEISNDFDPVAGETDPISREWAAREQREAEELDELE